MESTCTSNYQLQFLQMFDNGFVGVTCSPVHSFNRYVADSEAKCLFSVLKAFYFLTFPVFLSTCKTPATFILFNESN